jgi:hypothetical protein
LFSLTLNKLGSECRRQLFGMVLDAASVTTQSVPRSKVLHEVGCGYQ